ncbi:MAG: redoxin domain-containing protein [Victivallaceae bacterium]|nr:redoxin domain-containing protein [Victivallaceae bacterium]
MKILFLCLLIMNTLTCFALKVGEQAPELQIASWIKNGPATLAENKGKRICIVEFWATTCKPCIKVMPYFHKLKNQYKDLTIISISTENAAVVKNFITKYKDINYKIAVDDNNKTYNSYMNKNEKIPVAFIINKNGTVAWIGHPLDIYLPLKRIITGKFDIKESARHNEIYKKMQILLSQKKYTPALKIIEAELKKKPDNTQFIALKVYVLFNTEKKAEALEFAGSMLKKHPANMELFELKAYMLSQMKKYKELDAFYLDFINNCKEEPVLLNQLARQLLGTRFGEAKLEPALKAAELAYSNRKLYKLQRANIGETLARIYYMTGRIDRAVKIQKVVCRILKKNKKPKYIYALRILEYYERAYKLGQGQQLDEHRTSNIERSTSNKKK